MPMNTIISAGPSITNSLEGKPTLQRVITEYFGLFCLFLLVGYFVPDDETTLGAFSALPSLFLLAFHFLHQTYS